MTLNNPYVNPEKIEVLASDFTVNNTATCVDSGLGASLTIGKSYFLEIVCIVNSGSADGKIKFSASVDWVGTQLIGITTNAGGSGVVSALTPGNEIAVFGGGAVYNVFHMCGIFTIVTSGTLKIQFAQNTATVADSTLKAGSFIKYRQLN